MPYERIILGPRYAVRLEALQATDAILARCMACGRSWYIAPHRLHDRHWPSPTSAAPCAAPAAVMAPG